MRRTVVIFVFLVALLVPAAALAIHLAPSDGTLVIKNGSAPRGTPVVTLVIRGAAIGQISGAGKVVIEDPTPNDGFAPEVSGFNWHRDTGDNETTWGGAGSATGGQDFRFRAVGGVYKIMVYGSGVDLVVSGRGTAVLAGSPDTPSHDGVFSLNGSEFKSLPAFPTKQLTIGVPTFATG